MVPFRSALLAAAPLPAAFCIAFCVALCLGGCAAPPAVRAQTPEDLTVDVTILRGAGVADHPEAQLRPGRFVLFSDGALHYASELDPDFHFGADWLPAPTRAIDPEMMSDVWSTIERLHLMDDDATLPPTNLDAIVASPGQLTYVVVVTAGRRSRMRVDRVPDEPDARAETVDLVRLLAAMAWATDLPDANLATAPRRYDFGPDPYARFRKP